MPELLTPDEVVAEFKLPSKLVLYGWRHKGVGPPALKVGRHLRYRREDLDEWTQQLVEASRWGNDQSQ